MPSSSQTLIISDIHLGSTLSRAEDVMAFLESSVFQRLILLGDIFDGKHLHKFKKSDWQLLSYFLELENQGKEVVWIKGNHDVVDVENIPRLRDIVFLESYCWQSNGKTYCAIHGHQFDHLSVKRPSIKKFTSKLHSLFAAYMRHRKTAMILDKIHSRLRRLSKKISAGAIAYAKEKNIDYIFCAHTHIPLNLRIETDEQKQINYLNSGSWIQKPSSYIFVNEDGATIGQFV